MATVSVDINGRPYSVGCADGQEDRVRQLSREFDSHVRQVAQDVGSVGDLRLFLMAALLVSDELTELRAQVDRLNAEQGKSASGAADTGRQAALALTAAAERIEKLLTETA